MFKSLFALFFALFLSTTAFSASPEELDGFDAFVEKAMSDFRVPGVSVAIVKKNQVIWSKGYGHRDAEKKLPVTQNTLFPIGSITKSFTVTAMSMLVDQGKLNWDKPVRDYLPDFQMSTEEATKSLTLRDLVTHRSGLPRHDLIWYTSDISRENLVQRLRYSEMNKPIRYFWQYNNLLFVTAGYLAGTRAQSTWEDLVRKQILGPLGMSHSNFSVIDSQKSHDFAKPYQKSRKTEEVTLMDFHPLDSVSPAGSINSSVSDMSNYLLFHLNRPRAWYQQLWNGFFGLNIPGSSLS